MNTSYSREDLIRRDLNANRRRFQREGVAIVSGAPDRVYPAMGHDYYVRPATRVLNRGTNFDHFIDDAKDRLLDALERATTMVGRLRRWSPMNAIGRAFMVIAALSLAAVVVAQIIIHLHR